MVTLGPLTRTGDQPYRAALYGRASSDPKKRGRSIADQFADGRAECAARGWIIVGEYEDRDRSASLRATKRRESYERMVADVEAGKIDVIVYAERSRANRTLDGYVKLRRLCMRTGVLWCYDGDVYDLRKSRDRQITGNHALASEGEADAIADRAERTARLNAQRGGPHAHVPFGYKRKYDPDDGHLLGQFPHPAQAPVLRELFERADSYESYFKLLSFIRESCPEMTLGGMKLMLRNRAYIGIRVHGEFEYKAQWEPLVGEPLFQRVQARMDKSAVERAVRDTKTRRQLTGSSLCAVCREQGNYKDAGLRAKGPGKRFQDRYVCRLGHVSCSEKALNAYVEEAVLTWLGSEAARRAFMPVADDGDLEREVMRVQAMETQLAEAREQATKFDPETGLPMLSVASLAAVERQVVPLLAKAKGRVQQLLSVGDSLLESLLIGGRAEREYAWSNVLGVEQQRYVLRKVVRVELRKSLTRGPNQILDERRVGLIFPGEPGFEEWPRPPAGPGQ